MVLPEYYSFSRLDKTITSLSNQAEKIFERAEMVMVKKTSRRLMSIIENSAKIAESDPKDPCQH